MAASAGQGEQQRYFPILWELGPYTSPCSPTCFCSACLKKSPGCRQEAGQDLPCTKPQVRIMHETKGDSYKISDGKLKKPICCCFNHSLPCHVAVPKWAGTSQQSCVELCLRATPSLARGDAACLWASPSAGAIVLAREGSKSTWSLQRHSLCPLIHLCCRAGDHGIAPSVASSTLGTPCWLLLVFFQGKFWAALQDCRGNVEKDGHGLAPTSS